MTNLAEHAVPVPAFSRRSARHSGVAQRLVRCGDARWPAIAAALHRLRAAKRCSVRIVDADCGAGELLLCATRYASALGFTAIEARGIDRTPALIERAKAAAARIHDPAIGISLEIGDLAGALDAEAEFPADILLWHRCAACDGPLIGQALAAAGLTLIADTVDASEAAS